MSKKDDDERFWNFLVFDIYATDAEMMPVLGGLVIIIAVGVLLYWLLK